MQIPVEIGFRNVPHSQTTEDDIRERVARLERIYDRLTTCRVLVDQRNDNSKHTIPPVVRIEMSIPGHKDLVVNHEPDHLQRKFQAPDLRNAINEAFRIAERQLASHKDQLTDHTAEAQHEAVHEFVGQVAELAPGEDFGFLVTKEGGLLYFHRNSMLNGDFDGLARGAEVTYVEVAGDTGPTAAKVRVRARG